MTKHLAFAILLGTSSISALAQDSAVKPTQSIYKGYSQTGQGDVTRSGFGLCWRSGSWSPNDAVPGCDGPLAPPIANPIAPDLANSLEKGPPVTTSARCDFSMTLASDQTFAFGHAKLTEPTRQKIMAELKDRLSACQTIDAISITGHSDPIGNAQANRKLSEQRAMAVADILRQHQINAPIETMGVGSSQPVADCPAHFSKDKRITCFAPDRRVSISIRGPKK